MQSEQNSYSFMMENNGQKLLELYLHIPFCAQKCSYCDFLSFPADAETQEAYVLKLCEELRLTAPSVPEDMLVSSVFIGGGTPSLLEPRLISRLMLYVRKYYRLHPDAEISIECNPATTLRCKFTAYRDAGINRLSIGLQSASNEELRTLGRIHVFEDFLKCYQSARMEGFRNINVDLMNLIPGQNAESWKKTLKSVLMLKPEHLSVYNLIVEEGTAFWRMQQEGRLSVPDEEHAAEIDSLTAELTEKHGYHRYEISNYARPGYECRHNYGYWSDLPYLGFGLGASSYFNGQRFSNTAALPEYMALSMDEEAASGFPVLRKGVHALSRREQMEEFMFLGLRRTSGISEIEFTARFSVDIHSIFGEKLALFTEQGFLRHENFRYRFTDRGIDLSNVLLSEFLLEEG